MDIARKRLLLLLPMDSVTAAFNKLGSPTCSAVAADELPPSGAWSQCHLPETQPKMQWKLLGEQEDGDSQVR